jgi:hypothetical protein
MFGMSGGHNFVKDYAELNIVPTAISYEFDPGDFLKTREVYISRRQPYIKAKDEDINSILNGINQFKGRIHLAVAPLVTEEELRDIEHEPKNQRIQSLASLIDSRIYGNYYLWNTNYIAYDILNGNYFESIYSSSERAGFVEYMNKILLNIEGDKDELESIFLGIYANPVVNNIKVNGLKRQLYTNRIVNFESS